MQPPLRRTACPSIILATARRPPRVRGQTRKERVKPAEIQKDYIEIWLEEALVRVCKRAGNSRSAINLHADACVLKLHWCMCYLPNIPDYRSSFNWAAIAS